MAVDELRELPAGLVDLAGGYRGLQDSRQLGVPGDVFGRQWLLEPPQAVRAGRPLECASRSQRPVDGAIRIVGVECKPAAPADCLAGCRDPRGILLYGQATDLDLVVGEARLLVGGDLLDDCLLIGPVAGPVIASRGIGWHRPGDGPAQQNG